MSGEGHLHGARWPDSEGMCEINRLKALAASRCRYEEEFEEILWRRYWTQWDIHRLKLFFRDMADRACVCASLSAIYSDQAKAAARVAKDSAPRTAPPPSEGDR